MKKKTLANSEKWKIMEWMWDNLGRCPNIESITDVAAVEGTMCFVSSEGTEYTLTLKKGNWREIT